MKLKMYEIMWDIEDWDDGYTIVDSPTPEKACLDIIKRIIINGEKIPSSFYFHDLSHVSFDDADDAKEGRNEILTSDLISIMYLSNHVDCLEVEYA